MAIICVYRNVNIPKDFVRMDPSYTSDIEHLVFRSKKRNPNQVAPEMVPPTKTRSRLAEMFALSRHLQQRSADKEVKTHNMHINRSVDRILESQRDRRAYTGDSRWAAEEPVHATRVSPNERDMATTRGPNVSVIHLRSTSEPWETSPTSAFGVPSSSSRSCSFDRVTNTSSSTSKRPPTVSEINSTYKQYQNQWRSESYSSESYPNSSYHRELSPVRWCDREVDGVFLGKSGWVQVQHRSLDGPKKVNYSRNASFQSGSARTGLKLAQHQYTNYAKFSTDSTRPVYLPLKKDEFDTSSIIRTPSPVDIPLENSSPPSVTPIISPPLAFQDRNRDTKARTFFSKAPFLPRSNAIIDSDTSPPPSPPPTWKPIKVSPTNAQNDSKSFNSNDRFKKIAQIKSLEETSATRRSKFVQKHGESSSSSSSSMGFRSLDSCMPKRNVMPKLLEHTYSSIEGYEDADVEDNNSSSLNISIQALVKTSPDSTQVRQRLSPSSRASRSSSRSQLRRSPVGSDAKPTSPGSSSSSSNEYLYKSGARRTPPRQSQEDARVRRSRSLQLPEYNKDVIPTRISPQRTEAMKIVRSSNSIERAKKLSPNKLEQIDLSHKDLLREAEAVKDYLYGTRSRSAAQALLSQRYIKSEEKIKESYKGPDIYNFHVVADSSRQNKVLHRGSTTPNLGSTSSFSRQADVVENRKKVDNYKSLASMRPSKSYPSHQVSLEVTESQILAQESYKKRVPRNNSENKSAKLTDSAEYNVKRLSPNKNLSVEQKTSPQSLRSSGCTLIINKSSSSSSCDAYIIPCKPKNIKIYKGVDRISPSNEVTQVREVILTRPGSAPGNENKTDDLTAQQRSMSLPKSFLFKGGAMPWKKRGAESASSSPSSKKKIDMPQTAPVTPMHEANRRRSSKLLDTRRAKASSITHLAEPTKQDILQSRKSDIEVKEQSKEKDSSNATESVLQKFRKSFSLHFQKKNSRDNCSTDNIENLSDIMGESSDEDLQNVPASPQEIKMELEPTEQKHRFGPLSWRSNKNRKFASKVARSLKSTSGDSGINIECELQISTGSATNVGEDSSESHDTETPCEEFDSPPPVRRRKGTHRSTRPQSDLLNQILLDRFKTELKSRSRKSQHVRRANSDLGGRRVYRWDDSTCSHFMSSPTSLGPRPQRPRKKPPDGPPGVQMRNSGYRHGQLRRSLSQPLDIDRLSPLLITKSNGLKMTGTKTLSEDEQDEVTSDSESSLASLGDRKKSLELPVDEEMIILAEAVFDHVAIDAEELAFRAGDVIEVIETVNRDWWWGSTDGKSGWFPADSVRLRVSQEDTVEDCLAAMAAGKSSRSQIRRRTSISLLSNDQVRTSVVRELVHTERDFVKVLQDVVEGYLSECRKRTDMFTEEQIKSIFINLEDILKFQTSFLRDLESNIDWEAPHKSCVGSCFIKHKHGFTIYSDYCNSHPLATATLQELYQFNNFSKFFEACRLMRGLIEIPLDGYLLTPVQRICKYPLQLAELLKYTKPEHDDYNNIKEALDAMKEVAVLINERKRRMESLEKIAAWQQRVEGWEDDDLIDVSTQVIYQGEVVRVTSGMWTSNIILFLFDHQLVYCKKDILKRNTYIYKGRICLDTSEVIDVPNGKDIHLGVSVRHAIKLYSCIRDKWLLVCCRSAEDKKRWMQAFEDERKFVNQDKSEGLEFTPSLRQLAKVAARSQRRPPRKLRSNNNKNYKRDSSYMGSTLQLHASNFNSLGRKVGTWFTFGGKKTRHREVS